VNLVAGAPATEMDLAAGAPAMEMGTHVGDRHGVGAPVTEGRRTERVHRLGAHVGRGMGGGRCRAGVVCRTERAHGPRNGQRGARQTGRTGQARTQVGARAAAGVRRAWGACERAVRSVCFLWALAVRASVRSGSFFLRVCLLHVGGSVAWVSLIRHGPGYLLTSNGPTSAIRS
jgi:hypothetical protein